MEKLWCDHCKRPNHTKENCWKIHGKPANWKPQPRRDNPRSAYNVEAPIENKPSLNLSEDQIQALCMLLNQATAQPSTNNPQSTASLALQGNLQHYSLVSMCFSKNVWVIDTGASDHMTNSARSMTDYTLYDSSLNISMAMKPLHLFWVWEQYVYQN